MVDKNSKGNKLLKFKNNAFTLAEVLITLGIIGVVAALTIPLLQNNATEQEYNTGCKNTYQAISNALTTILSNNGGTIDANTSHSNLRDEFANVMKFIKVGNENQIFVDKANSAIWYQFYKSASTCNWPPVGGASASAVLSDGSYIGFYSNTDCNFSYAGSNICAIITADINGASGPNTVGKDFFYFWLENKNNTFLIVPGGTNDGKVCTPGSCNWNGEFGCTTSRLFGQMP